MLKLSVKLQLGLVEEMQPMSSVTMDLRKYYILICNRCTS